MLKKILLLMVVLHLTVIPAQAKDNPLTKLVRGVVNISTGWWESPRQIKKVSPQDEDIPRGFGDLFWKSTKGVFCFVGRTASGAYETVTFFLPSYKSLVNPEFVFSQEEDE